MEGIRHTFTCSPWYNIHHRTTRVNHYANSLSSFAWRPWRAVNLQSKIKKSRPHQETSYIVEAFLWKAKTLLKRIAVTFLWNYRNIAETFLWKLWKRCQSISKKPIENFQELLMHFYENCWNFAENISRNLFKHTFPVLFCFVWENPHEEANFLVKPLVDILSFRTPGCTRNPNSHLSNFFGARKIQFHRTNACNSGTDFEMANA